MTDTNNKTELNAAEQMRIQAQKLLDEAAAMDREAKELERKAKEAAHKAKQEAEAKKLIADRTVWANHLALAVAAETETREAFGFKAADVKVGNVTPSFIGLTINGKTYHDIDIKKEFSGSKWYSSPTGKIRISVGDYGHKQSFPQKKDGSFSWNKMAEVIVNDLVQQLNWTKKRNVTETNAQIVVELGKELGYGTPEKFWTIPFEASDNEKFPIKMKLSCTTELTKEKAAKVLAIWQQLQAELKAK
jgi:ribosomal protein S19